MADVLRSCAKTGCRWPAAASLSYRYATRQVWLLDLASAPDPSLYDLCPHHADHLVVPKGWEAVDDRTVHEVMVEPSAFDRAEQAARRRMADVEPVSRHAGARPRQLVGAGAGRNRYAALVEHLPQLAAQQAERAGQAEQPEHADQAEHAGHLGQGRSVESHDPGARDSGPPPAAEPRDPAPGAAAPPPPAPPGPLADRPRTGPTTGGGRPAPPVPARELAPRAADDVTPPSGATPAHPPPPPAGDEALPGQLSIPVEDVADSSTGVVLQFDLAGGRRRAKGS